MKDTNTKKNETKTIKEETTMKTTTSHNVGKANPAVIADIRTRVTAGTVTGNTYNTLKECKRSIPKINTIMWQNLDLIIERLPTMTDDEIADLINNGGENPVITNVEAEPVLITEISTEAKAKAEADRETKSTEDGAYTAEQFIADLENLVATATDGAVKTGVQNAIPEIKKILGMSADTEGATKVAVEESATTDTVEQTDEPSVTEQSVEPDPVLITEISTEAKATKVEVDQTVDSDADPVTVADQINPETTQHSTPTNTTHNTKHITAPKKEFVKPYTTELFLKLIHSVKTHADYMVVAPVTKDNWNKLYPTFKYLLA